MLVKHHNDFYTFKRRICLLSCKASGRHAKARSGLCGSYASRPCPRLNGCARRPLGRGKRCRCRVMIGF
ncbi:hypothetical protein CHELA1G11_20381 [Hyphomicrobiales bacterium]|nr:hypothetical protein CHELA1G11_20381 [Hyphomicrobiales bacterium]